MTPLTEDAIVGCLLGGALGDALGHTHEGRDGGVLAAPRHVSDDTQLTLATAEAIVGAEGAVDPSEIAATFGSWFRRGLINGMGSATLKALRELAVGGHWALVGRRGEFAAGNGAATRIAPVAFALDFADPFARRTVRDIVRITHHNDEAYAGALAMCLALRHDGRAADLLGDVAAELPDTRVRDRLVDLSGARSIADAATVHGSSGYVVDSVPLALLAARDVTDPESLVAAFAAIVAAGGDTDSIGSMAGQVAGVRLGGSGLPRRVVAALDAGPDVVRAARALWAVVRGVERRSV